MSFDSFLIKAMALLVNSSFVSSFISSDFSSFVLNTFPLNAKIPFSKKPIISLLALKNFTADSKTFFSLLFLTFFRAVVF